MINSEIIIVRLNVFLINDTFVIETTIIGKERVSVLKKLFHEIDKEDKYFYCFKQESSPLN